MDAPPPPQQPLPPPLPHPPPHPPPAADAQPFVMLCHLSAFAGLFVPLGNIWGPLIFWLIKKDEFPEVDLHGKESLNFQISLTIYMVVAFFLSFLLIGLPILLGLAIMWIVVVIIASVRANAGELYRYPLTIRFIS